VIHFRGMSRAYLWGVMVAVPRPPQAQAQAGLGAALIKRAYQKPRTAEPAGTALPGYEHRTDEGGGGLFARSVLRHIRVGSKQELKERIMGVINDVNRYLLIHTWSYKL
jgi:hypothetical protein